MTQWFLCVLGSLVSLLSRLFQPFFSLSVTLLQIIQLFNDVHWKTIVTLSSGVKMQGCWSKLRLITTVYVPDQCWTNVELKRSESSCWSPSAPCWLMRTWQHVHHILHLQLRLPFWTKNLIDRWRRTFNATLISTVQLSLLLIFQNIVLKTYIFSWKRERERALTGRHKLGDIRTSNIEDMVKKNLMIFSFFFFVAQDETLYIIQAFIWIRCCHSTGIFSREPSGRRTKSYSNEIWEKESMVFVDKLAWEWYLVFPHIRQPLLFLYCDHMPTLCKSWNGSSPFSRQ